MHLTSPGGATVLLSSAEFAFWLDISFFTGPLQAGSETSIVRQAIICIRDNLFIVKKVIVDWAHFALTAHCYYTKLKTNEKLHIAFWALFNQEAGEDRKFRDRMNNPENEISLIALNGVDQRSRPLC